MPKKKPVERIVNPVYLKDPDLLAIVEDHCPATGEVYGVEVGFSYQYKNGGMKTIWYDDVRLNQLRAEADVVWHKPFVRVEADENSFRPEHQPEPTVKKAAAPRLRTAKSPLPGR